MSQKVPEGWTEATLATVSDFIGRGDAPRYAEAETDMWAVGQRCVREGTIDLSVRRPHDPGKKIKDRSVLRDGDICVNSTGTGTLGRVALWTAPGAGIHFADTHITVVRPRNEVVPKILSEWLQMKAVQDELHTTCVTGSTNQIELSRSALGLLRVLLPPLPEQRRIAEILSSVDEAIATTQAVIEQTRTVKQGVLKRLLTKGIGHTTFRLVDDWTIGRLPTSEIPDTWRLVKLTDIALLESGHTPSKKVPQYWDGDVPWLSLHDSKNMKNMVIYDTQQKTTEEGIANSSARMLPVGTVCFSRTATIGHCVILGKEMATSQDFANYVCGPKLSSRFLLHLFRWMKPIWNQYSGGSTHKTIYMPIFKNMQIALPPLVEQERIADVADSFTTEIETLEQGLQSLAATKSALMSDLLTGRKRVPMAELAAAE